MTMSIETPETVGNPLPENLYLFDERNRDFLEYRASDVYPRTGGLKDNLLKAAVWMAILLIPLLALLAMISSNLSAMSDTSTDHPQLLLSTLLLIGLATVVGLAIVGFPIWLRGEREKRRTLIFEGKVIFVPIEKCTLIRSLGGGRYLSTMPIMRLRCTFVSPRSCRTMTRSFAAKWPHDGRCLAVGTPIALLFQSYKNFQVL